MSRTSMRTLLRRVALRRRLLSGYPASLLRWEMLAKVGSICMCVVVRPRNGMLWVEGMVS